MTLKPKLIFSAMNVRFVASSLVNADLELNQATPLARLAGDVGAGSMVQIGIVLN